MFINAYSMGQSDKEREKERERERERERESERNTVQICIYYAVSGVVINVIAVISILH